MKKVNKFICIFVIFWALTANAMAESIPGISFYVLRVIYTESEKQGAILKAYNKTSSPYLIESLISPVDQVTGDVHFKGELPQKMPFVVTPPLARLESNNELTLRIRRNDVVLPDDRESVFYISLKALPVMQPSSEQMVMTVVSNIKLFYRPESLSKRAVEESVSKLRFERKDNLLTAINPTPYWLTFSHLQVGAISLDKGALRVMVPPYGRQSYSVGSVKGPISWKLIDEDGWDTKEAIQKD